MLSYIAVVMYRLIPRNCDALRKGQKLCVLWQTAPISYGPLTLRSIPIDSNPNAHNCANYDQSSLPSCLVDGQIGPSDIAFGVKYITQQQYQRLYSNNPNLMRNMRLAFTQLFLSGKLADSMNSILSDSSMKVLFDLIEENVSGFTPRETAETLQSLMFIDYDKTCPTMHKMLAHTRQMIPHMDIQCLSMLATVIPALRWNDYRMLYLVLNRHRELLEKKMCPYNASTLLAHSILSARLSSHQSLKMKHMSSEFLLNLLTDSIPAAVLTPDLLVEVIRANVKLSLFTGEVSSPVNDEIRKIIHKYFVSNINTLQPYHLRHMKKILLQTTNFSAVKTVMDARVKDLIDEHGENLPLNEVANLLLCLSKSSERFLCHKVETLLFKKMLEDEIDVMLLTDIAKALVVLQSNNSELLE